MIRIGIKIRVSTRIRVRVVVDGLDQGYHFKKPMNYFNFRKASEGIHPTCCGSDIKDDIPAP